MNSDSSLDSSFVSPYGAGSPSPSLRTTAMSPVILAPENDMRCSGTPVWQTSSTPVCSSATPVGQPGSSSSGEKAGSGFSQQPLSVYNNSGPEQSPFELCCITPTHSLFSSSVEKKAAARRRGASNVSITTRVRTAGRQGAADGGFESNSRSLPHTTSSGRVVRRRGGAMTGGMGRGERGSGEWGGFPRSAAGRQEEPEGMGGPPHRQYYLHASSSAYHLHHADQEPADGGEDGQPRGRSSLKDANARMHPGVPPHSVRHVSSLHKGPSAHGGVHQHGNVAAAAAAATAMVNYSFNLSDAHTGGQHARRQPGGATAPPDMHHAAAAHHFHGSARASQVRSRRPTRHISRALYSVCTRPVLPLRSLIIQDHMRYIYSSSELSITHKGPC